MKYKFAGVPNLHRVIAENEPALGVMLSSGAGVVGLIHATYDEMTAVANGGIKITHSACAVVVEAQTPRVSYAISSHHSWSGLQYQERSEKSSILGHGIYLPEGWRILTGSAPEIRKAFTALQVRRATPAKTTVEVIA